MSKKFNNLEELKDVQIPNEGEKPVEQNPETPVPVEEKKPGFAGRVGMKLCAMDEKAAEKKKAKKQALEQKKLAKEEKKPISKGKVIAGAAIGVAVLGAVGKALLNVAANAQNGNVCGEPEDLTELDDTPVEEVNVSETEE